MSLFVGEKYCRKVSAERVWAIYQKLLGLFERHKSSKHSVPKLEIQPIPRGWAFYVPEPKIVLPSRALLRCEEWVTYYLAHELAHHSYGHLSHGMTLCAIEGEMLRAFGILIEYNGGRRGNRQWYPRRLIRIGTAETICYEKGREKP